MTQPRVALIGLGLMGSGMARRLLGAGFRLTVHNRNPERVAPWRRRALIPPARPARRPPEPMSS